VIKSEDNAAAIEDIANFSYNQFKDCLVFLEDLYSRDISGISVERNHHLALAAVFALEDRLNEIVAEFEGFDFLENEFCDGGVSNMVASEAQRRLNTVIRMILQKFHGCALSNKVILSMEILRNAVSKRIGAQVLDHSCQIYTAKECLLDLYQYLDKIG
jgi:hypothetical protein